MALNLRWDNTLRRRTLLSGAAAMCVPMSASAAHARERRPFLRGINTAWLGGAFDHDFGVNPRHPDWGCWFDLGKVRQALDDVAGMNFEAVRVWAFEGCEGLRLDARGHAEGLDPTFERNFRAFLNECGTRQLRAYVCLTSSWPADRPSPVTDRRARAAYLNEAVRPFAASLEDHDAVFAVDVFNEVESEVLDEKVVPSHRTDVAGARSFVKACAAVVRRAAPRLLVSAGSGWRGFDSLAEGLYGGLGLDFWDAHAYLPPAQYPPAADLTRRVPVVIGDFGHTQNLGRNPRLQEATLQEAYAVADRLLYYGLFAWMLDFPGTDRQFSFYDSDGRLRPVADAARQANADFARRFDGVDAFVKVVTAAR